MNNVTQSAQPRKGQSAPGSYIRTDFCLDTADMSHQLRDDLATAILNGPNDQALNILNAVKVFPAIPGANFTPLNEIENYYGISEKYLHSVMTRRGFIKKAYPDDIKQTTWNQVKYLPGACIQPVERSDKFGLCQVKSSNRRCCQSVLVPSSGKFMICSPRMVLAISLYISNSTKSSEADIGAMVRMAIKRSTYRDFAEPAPEAAVDNTVESPAPEAAAISVTPELLQFLIHTAVKESLNAVADKHVGH